MTNTRDTPWMQVSRADSQRCELGLSEPPPVKHVKLRGPVAAAHLLNQNAYGPDPRERVERENSPNQAKGGPEPWPPPRLASEAPRAPRLSTPTSMASAARLCNG